MSRDLHVLALDLDAFRAVQGSGDQQLLRRIESENLRRITAHDDFFRHQDPFGFVPLLTAVKRIVDGTVDGKAGISLQYEHAAALLADMLGDSVDEDAVREVVSDFYEDVDSVIRQRTSAIPALGKWPPLGEVMCRGPLLDVPVDPTARLGTGYLTPAEVNDALAVAKLVDLDDQTGLRDINTPEDALEIAAGYRDWLAAAAQRYVGLFFHF